MKKLLLLLLLPITIFSQELPLDFSDTLHRFVETQGTDAEFNLITDPTDPSNEVAEIISSTAYSDVFELVLSKFIDVTDTSNNSISFDYYSTITGVRNGVLQLDDEQFGELPIRVSFTTSGAIGWETISVDFDNSIHPYPNVSTPVTLSSYGKLTLMLSNGNPTSVSTCYIDNINGAQNGIPYNILDGDAILTTQQEVDDFGAIGYSKVLGSLKIISSTAGTSTDITDLTPLNTIHTIRSLEITDNNNLTSLNGLNRIKTIGGTLILKNNSTLNSLSSLSGLNYFYSLNGEFTIENNDSLLSLDGLQNISFFLTNTVNIINNDSLVSISNINMDSNEIIVENNQSLQTISNIDFGTTNTVLKLFHIKDNVNLTSISNITGTVYIGGPLIIDNNNLNNLSGLENMQFGYGGFLQSDGIIIKNNNNLISLNGLNPNLGLLGGAELDNNPLLSDISYLSNLSNYIFLRFKNSPSISSLNILNTVTSCGEIVIEGTNGFTNLSGLENIDCSGTVHLLNSNLNDISQLGLNNSLYSVRIEDNQSITDLSVFNSLEIMDRIGFVTLNIINNNQLATLNGFDNLHTFDGYLKIENNDVLNDFCALSNLFSTGTFGISYIVSGNEYNPNQQSVADMNNCSSLSVNDFFIEKISIYPNPTTDYININTNETILKTELYNLHGQKVNASFSNNIVDVRNISKGIYFLKLQTDKGTVTKKIIKE